MEKLDYKKAYPELYTPKTQPSIVDVPEMIFIAVEGRGDPNTSESYAQAMKMLYSLSFTIKMSKMGGSAPDGYFDYVVPPLEGLWWMEGLNGVDYSQKNRFQWVSMIRQPEFVTDRVFTWAKEQAAKKNPDLDYDKARLWAFCEGLCVQCMHIGPYDNEPATVAKMDEFCTKNGVANDFNDLRRHHEIYLGDPRRTAPERLRTVVRHPIKKV